MNIYFVASLDRFIKPIINELTARGYACTLSNQFDKNLAAQADVIWCERADQNALIVQEYITTAKKILRVRRCEIYSDIWSTLLPGAFDHVIFVSAEKCRELSERIGGIPNATVINNYLDVAKYEIAPDKQQNNNIAYAGYFCRKKGIGELLLLAESLPDYNFFFIGEPQEDDYLSMLNADKPENVTILKWTEDLPSFYQSMSYVINASLNESYSVATVEGMLCGCKPIMRNWRGVNEFYPPNCIYKSIDDVKRILSEYWNPEEYRQYAIGKHRLGHVIDDICELIQKPEMPMELPSITVGIIQTRQKYMGDLMNSLKLQGYPLQIRVLQNFDRDMTIGRAYNKLADECDTDFIIYVGDDDWLAENYISSIMDAYMKRKDMYPNTMAMLTSTTAFDETGRYALIPHHSTGVWRTDVVRKHRFDETLVRQVDTEFHKRMLGLKEGNYTVLQLTWLAGYMYRQHNKNISGNKFTEGANTSQEPPQ